MPFDQCVCCELKFNSFPLILFLTAPLTAQNDNVGCEREDRIHLMQHFPQHWGATPITDHVPSQLVKINSERSPGMEGSHIPYVRYYRPNEFVGHEPVLDTNSTIVSATGLGVSAMARMAEGIDGLQDPCLDQLRCASVHVFNGLSSPRRM